MRTKKEELPKNFLAPRPKPVPTAHSVGTYVISRAPYDDLADSHSQIKAEQKLVVSVLLAPGQTVVLPNNVRFSAHIPAW